MEDIGGNVDCSLDKFKQKSCNIDLKSKPQGISMRELTPIDTWFEYFDNLFHWESIYMEQIVKYGDLYLQRFLWNLKNTNNLTT